MHEAHENDGQIEAAVEAVLDLSEVAMSVLVVVERMVGSGEGGLQIAQQGVDGSELFELDAGRAAASDGALVGGAALKADSFAGIVRAAE